MGWRLQKSAVVETLDAWAQEWIGWSFPPVVTAVRDAQWQPDDPTAYCPRCGDSVGCGEATATGCGSCREGGEFELGLGDGVIRLGTYSEPLREWITAVKFAGWSEIGQHLGMLLGRAVRRSGMVDPATAVVVPAPMPWIRRIYRGIDHTSLLADALARELGAPKASILAKANMSPQITLSPTERRRQGGRGLSVRRRLGGWPVKGLQIVLVDDVRTTGATLKGAARLLQTLGPSRIVCAVVAVADAKARRDRAHQGHTADLTGNRERD